MTKTVRIENADTSSYKILVQIWDKGRDGEPDKMASEEVLSHPTMMCAPYITDTRYLVIKEKFGE